MSGLAVIHLKKPSLLQFDLDRVKCPDGLRNLKSTYFVTRTPCDTYLREMLDPIETRHFRKFFTRLFVLFSAQGASGSLNILTKGTCAYSGQSMAPGISAQEKSTARSAAQENVTKVIRGGRAKWKIENETFNTLKAQDYNLEHNYGHGRQHLATNLACLTFVAFLINQVEQLACK